MKKLSLVFAMVFAASVAMAQTAVINQTSLISDPQSVQTATVTQTGASTANITQNTEKIDHATSQLIKFDHVAIATQSGGNGNSIVISQIAEEHINGGSYINVAEAVQVGSTNIMNQTQISGNYTSGGMNFKSYQTGKGNVGTQYGKKTESDFDLYQNGSRNISNQATTGEKTGVLVGNVTQIGTSNNATQLFHGENVRYAGGVIDQNGTSNTAVQEFSGSTSLWNDPSHADIIQRSSDNYAYQSQVGMGSYQKTEQYGKNNDAYMYSNGNFNTAYARQDGTNALISINQKQTTANASVAADGNLAKVYQTGNHSEAYVMQDGFRNKVLGLNGEDYAVNNNDSYINVSQTGVDNLVRSQQTAINASETVIQVGANNTATVNQF